MKRGLSRYHPSPSLSLEEGGWLYSVEVEGAGASAWGDELSGWTRRHAVVGSCNSRKLKDNRAEVTPPPPLPLSSIVTGSASNSAATGQCASTEFHPRISCNCQTLVASDTAKERNGRRIDGELDDERRKTARVLSSLHWWINRRVLESA